jgi:hypothetical protein
MTEQIVQEDFGGFNPRFYGVTYTLSTPASLEVLGNYFEHESFEREQASLGQIAIRSVIEHEMRHYHDFLLSPYSSSVFRLRLQGLVNGSQAVHMLKRLSGNCCPAPITRWMTLDDSARQAQLRDWRELIDPPGNSDWQPVTLPVVAPDELLPDAAPGFVKVNTRSIDQQFQFFVRTAVMGYERIRQIVDGFSDAQAHPELRPCNVYEATALTTQLCAIYQSQGLIQALQLVNFLFDSNLGYARLWETFMQLALLLEQHRHPGEEKARLLFAALPTVMVLSVWCLLGSFRLEGKDACPTLRFMRLASHLLDDHTDHRNRSASVADMWDYWDSETGVLPWRDSLNDLLDFNKRGLSAYAQMADAWDGPKDLPDLVQSLMRAFVADQQRIVEVMLSDPDLAVMPTRYLNAPDGTFPVPFAKYRLEGFAVNASKFDGRAARALQTLEIDGQLHTTSFVMDPSGANGRDGLLDAALQTEELMTWCDVLFTEQGMTADVYERARRGLEQYAGKRILLIV